MKQNPLDLSQLTIEDVDFSGVKEGIAEIQQKEKEYEAIYGSDWMSHYIVDSDCYCHIDSDEQIIDRAIYEGHRPVVVGQYAGIIERKYWEKMRRIFGPFCERYVNHEQGVPKVSRALIKDAMKSGKWKELPEPLHAQYHRMAENRHHANERKTACSNENEE